MAVNKRGQYAGGGGRGSGGSVWKRQMGQRDGRNNEGWQGLCLRTIYVCAWMFRVSLGHKIKTLFSKSTFYYHGTFVQL